MTKTVTTSGHSAIFKPFSGLPTLIPALNNGKFEGKVLKVERTGYRNELGGVKEHLWFMPDPHLHNHPWEFISCSVIHGWYRATEYHPNGTGGFHKYEKIMRTGDPAHIVPHDVYHQVDEVAKDTFSVMTFGPVAGDLANWKYLNPNSDGTFTEESPVPSAEYLNALRHLNPHVRPDGWVTPFDFKAVTLNDLIDGINT